MKIISVKTPDDQKPREYMLFLYTPVTTVVMYVDDVNGFGRVAHVDEKSITWSDQVPHISMPTALLDVKDAETKGNGPLPSVLGDTQGYA